MSAAAVNGLRLMALRNIVVQTIRSEVDRARILMVVVSPRPILRYTAILMTFVMHPIRVRGLIRNRRRTMKKMVYVWWLTKGVILEAPRVGPPLVALLLSL